MSRGWPNASACCIQLAWLVQQLSYVMSCRSNTCPVRLSTAWLVSLVVFSWHMVSKWWQVKSICRLWGGWYALPRTISFCSHSVDYNYGFCTLPDPDVGISFRVCDVEHTSFHFGICGRKFVLCCLVSVQVSAPYVIAGSTQAAHMICTPVSTGR